MALLRYEGYTLYAGPAGRYRSEIDGEVILFDTASQWVQYINLIKGKS